MMRDCADGDMRDLLPEYVHGTLSADERATVATHLESCADCVAEAELIATASRALHAPNVNVSGILKALKVAPRGSRRDAFTGPAWRVAAAIGIVALGAFSVVALRDFFGGTPKQTASAPAPAASTALAVAAPATAPAAAPVASDSPARANSPAAAPKPRASGISFGGGISDLTDDQLNTLLGELDALQALPSAEPETHLSPIVPLADGGHNAR
jgi:anti-sigma factor RsiW